MKYIKLMLILIFWLTLSIFLAHLWISNPDQLPHLPSSVWRQFDRLYQSTNAEEVADLEFVVSVAISAMVAGVGFFACRHLLSRRGKRNE